MKRGNFRLAISEGQVWLRRIAGDLIAMHFFWAYPACLMAVIILFSPSFSLALEDMVLPRQNSYLTPLPGVGHRYSGIGLGFDFKTDRERRFYRKIVLASVPGSDSVLPLNTDYDIKENFSLLRTTLFSREGGTDNSLFGIEGDALFPLNSYQGLDIHSDPAISGQGRVLTQDFSGVEGRSRRFRGDVSVVWVSRLTPNSEIRALYKYHDDYYRREWNYRIIRNDSAGTQSVNRNEQFSLVTDNGEHKILLGYRYVTPGINDRPDDLLIRDLDFVKPPLLTSGAYYLETNAEVRFVNNKQNREFRYIDSLYPSLQGWGAPEFIFFQEEDYSNNPRIVRDRYQQYALEIRTLLGIGSNSMVGVQARYELPVKWTRSIEHLDGPYVWTFFPGPPRSFSDQDDSGKKQYWKLIADLTYRFNPLSECKVSQTIKGRRDGYRTAYSTNWTWGQGTPWFDPGRESLEENISEDCFETVLSYTKLFGPFIGPTPTILDYLDRPFLVSGQTLCHPYFGFRKVNYCKAFNYFYAVPGVGPDWMDIDMSFNQFFLGVNYSIGLSPNSMLLLNTFWDLPAKFSHHSPYRWDYRFYNPTSDDWSSPSGGTIEGSVTKFTLFLDLIYRPNPDLQCGFELYYYWNKVTSDYELGPYNMPAAGGLLPFSDKFGLSTTRSSLNALASIRRFF